MILYILVTLAVTGLGWFVNTSYRRQFNICTAKMNNTSVVSKQGYVNRIALFAIFFILFAVSALRVGTGNDYWVYRTGFLQINVGDTPVSYELGFKAVVLLMQKIFYRDCYKEIFALFALLTAAFFVKGLYDFSDWFMGSIFIFMANGFYFMSFSNVRYYFAFALVMCSFLPLIKERYFEFVMWILIAALFHKTALIAIPAFLVAYFLKWSKKTLWLIPAAAAGLVVGKSVIRFLIFKFYPFYVGDPLDSGEVSYVNIAKCLAVLIFALVNYDEGVKGNKKAEMLFNLNIFALLLYTFASYIPELTRICYYMVVGQVFLIPMILCKLGTKKKKILWTVAIGVAYAGYFAFFLMRGNRPGINILPYLRWLFG